MSDEQDKLKASLEPPRLFGRKKKSGPKGATKPARAPSRGKTRKPAEPAEPAPETPEAPGDEVDEPAAATPVPETAGAASAEMTEPVDEAAPEPVEDVEDDPAVADTEGTQVLEEEPAPQPGATQVIDDEPAPPPEATQVIDDEPAPPPEATQVIDDEPAPQPEADPVAEATESDEEAVEVDEDDETPAQPVPDEPPQPSVSSRLAGRVRSRWGPKPTPVEDEKPAAPATPAHGQIEVEPEPVSETEAEDAEIAARGTPYTAPMLDHYPAAALTGALVGLAMVVLTWLSLRGCEAIRGTATCGGGPGLLLLLAVFIVSVMLGNAILKSFLVPDPASSSFLAVGLVAVVALLLLIDTLDSWVMLIAIPLISIAAYLLSVYLTKTFVEPANDS